MAERYDFLVVGGGIAGASLSARLAEHGSLAILEAEDRPGYHTSGRSAATYIENYGSPAIRALNRASRAFFESPPDWFEGQPLLADRGVLYLAGPDDGDALEAEFAAGEGLTRLDPAGCAELVPVVANGPSVAGLLEASARDIDVDLMLRGCLAATRKAGGVVRTGARVGAARRDNGLWRVETEAGDFEAPVVVNAAGAWGDRLATVFGARPLGLTPMRRSVAIVSVSGSVPVDAGWPLLAGVAGDWYCKPQGEWLLVSPADETPSEPCDAWPEDLDLAEGIERMTVATGYEVTRLRSSWAGLRTFAPDRGLVGGYDADAEGFFWLVGQGGYGFQTAPAMAAAACSLVIGESLAPALTAHGVEASALDPRRFLQ